MREKQTKSEGREHTTPTPTNAHAHSSPDGPPIARNRALSPAQGFPIPEPIEAERSGPPAVAAFVSMEPWSDVSCTVHLSSEA